MVLSTDANRRRSEKYVCSYAGMNLPPIVDIGALMGAIL